MLCFVCLTENRDAPNKSVTFVQGTAVCREHVTSVGGSDLMSLSHKIKEAVSQRAKQNANGPKRPPLDKSWIKTVSERDDDADESR